MPKQYFSREFGDSAFKTIITKDSKGNETGHVSAEIVDELTFQADDGSYVSADPSTGEVLISSDTRWADKTDGEQIKFYKDRNSFGKMETGTLALIKGQGVFYKDGVGDPKHVSPGFVTGQTFPEHATVGTLFLSSNNQLFLCVGQDTESNKPNWLKLGTSTVSTGSNLIWNESGAHMTSVADNNNYYAGSNVEDILNELATRLPLYFTQREIGTGDNEISYGHLVDSPDGVNWNNFKWGNYNNYIDEIYNPQNGNYYINRKDLGVRISKSEKIQDADNITVAGEQLNLSDIQDRYSTANPTERTLFIKHKVGENDYDYEQLATKKYAHYLLSCVPKSKLMVETTPDKDMHNRPYDLWTEFAYYNEGHAPKWFNASDKGKTDPLNPITSDGSVVMGARPVYLRTHYNFTRREYKPDNYVYLFDDENGKAVYQSLLPDVFDNNPTADNDYKNQDIPPLNEAMRRYVMNHRYTTNSPFYMDVNNEINKQGFLVYKGIKKKLSDGYNWTVGKRNIFNANDDEVLMGDPDDYLENLEIRAKKTKFYGGDIEFGTSHVKIGGVDKNGDKVGDGKLTISGDLELTGRMTNNSDLYFNLYGAGGAGITDRSVVNIGFKSDDAQVQGSLTADCRNKYGDKEQYNYQANLFLNDDMRWFKYNSIGRFGLRDNNVGEYFLVRESTYDFTYDKNGNFDGIAKQIKELDSKISKEKNDKTKQELINQRNTLLRAKERSLMTTLGGTGQTMIKSNNSAVVLRSDAKSGPKVVASAPQGDVFSVRSGKGGVIQFGFNEDVKNFSSTAYNKGGINYIDSRGADGKYTNRQELALISTGEYHNADNGVFQFENGQQWNDSFIAIGAVPKKTSWSEKVPGKTITHSKNYGDSTLDGHLRLYSCTKPRGNKDEYNVAINNYARIDFDVNMGRINFKYVDERLKDYAKTRNAAIQTGSIYNDNFISTRDVSAQEAIFGDSMGLSVDQKKKTLKVNKTCFYVDGNGVKMNPYLYSDWKPDPETEMIEVITKDGKFMGQDLFIRNQITNSKGNKETITYSLKAILQDLISKAGLKSKYSALF